MVGCRPQGLNADVQSYVQLKLQRPQRQCAPAVRHAWQYLFESWRTAAASEVLNNYALKQVIEANGWNALAVQRYGELCRPYLKVTRPFWTGPKPPNHTKNMNLSDLVNVEIEFPHLDHPITVPAEYLAAVLAELRQNLHRTVAMGNDGFHGVASSDLPPIAPDPNLAGFTSTRDLGLFGTVTSYLMLFGRLLEIDPDAAKVEAQTWLSHADPVFTRLTIWACSDPRLVPDDRVGPTLATIDDEGFWGSRHQRDLLLTLEKRWADLPQPAQKHLEARILKDPKRWPKVSKVEFERHRINMILDRLYWLHQHTAISPSTSKKSPLPSKRKCRAGALTSPRTLPSPSNPAAAVFAQTKPTPTFSRYRSAPCCPLLRFDETATTD